MQSQAYLIWIMYKTLIEAVCLHQSGGQAQETKGSKKDRVVESEGESASDEMCKVVW